VSKLREFVSESVGAENTFSIDLTEFEAMVSELQPLIDKVWRYCEDKATRGRTVTLKVKFADFETDLPESNVDRRGRRTVEGALPHAKGRQAARRFHVRIQTGRNPRR
jgi:nucleotidyltransferase/DNA polymerase involved in DNA repair